MKSNTISLLKMYTLNKSRDDWQLGISERQYHPVLMATREEYPGGVREMKGIYMVYIETEI